MTSFRRLASRPPAALLAMAALTLTSCRHSSPPVDPARALPPPAGYAEEIARDRAAKNAFFRADAGSPLPESARGSFQGLDYYPVDPAYRFTGKLSKYRSPKRLTIAGSRGENRVALRWAVFSFVLRDRTHTLQIYKLFEPGEPEGHPFLPFMDETTGRETYPAGRYVDPEVDAQGDAIVDFNRAYYPFCAYGKAYDCPLTPAENRLDVSMPAGERGRLEGLGGKRS